uniref:Uncharacterized protein n=1 Tax=Micrurus lemniscatus lemniscatus TaxID=129467 RepID=A0A2D4JQA4_MICLE
MLTCVVCIRKSVLAQIIDYKTIKLRFQHTADQFTILIPTFQSLITCKCTHLQRPRGNSWLHLSSEKQTFAHERFFLLPNQQQNLLQSMDLLYDVCEPSGTHWRRVDQGKINQPIMFSS